MKSQAMDWFQLPRGAVRSGSAGFPPLHSAATISSH